MNEHSRHGLRAIVSGYYGAGNPGDELILSALLHSLDRTGMISDATVLSSNPTETSRSHGIRSISRPTITYRSAYRLFAGVMGSGEIVRSTRTADVVIIGGGGLLEDVHHFGSIPMHLQVACLGLLFMKPVIGLGLGVGPILTSGSRHLVKLICQHMDFLSVRDSESADVLVHCGVDRDVISVGADLVFSTHGALEARARASRGRTIGITLGPADWVDLDLKELATGIEAASHRLPAHEVVIFRMGASQSDELLLRKFSGLLSIPHRVESERKTGEEIATRISEFDVLVASKLHALIVGACVGVPAVAISYAPKVSSLARMLSIPLHQADHIDPRAIETDIIDASQWSDRLHTGYGDKVRALAQLSDREVGLGIARAAATRPRGEPRVIFDAMQYALLAPLSYLRQIPRSRVGNLVWTSRQMRHSGGAATGSLR